MATVGQLILQRLGVDPIVVERMSAGFGAQAPVDVYSDTTSANQETPQPPAPATQRVAPTTGEGVNKNVQQKVGAITLGGSGGTPDNPADLPFPFNLLPKLPAIPGLPGGPPGSPWSLIDWKMALLGLAAIGIGAWVLVKIIGSLAGAAPAVVKVIKPI